CLLSFYLLTYSRGVLSFPTRRSSDLQGSHLPVLGTVSAIRALSQDQAARGFPVHVRAIVTHFDEVAHVSLVIHDGQLGQFVVPPDRKSTRLNSSHQITSYAVFCLKKK